MRKGFVLLLLILFVVLTAQLGSAEKTQNKSLKSLFSEYPELENYEGKTRTFECTHFPQLYGIYRKPNITQWFGQLKEIEKPQQGCFTQIWFQGDAIEYIKVDNIVHAIKENRIERISLWGSDSNFKGDPETLFFTPKGIYKWEYEYENDLVKRIYYKFWDGSYKVEEVQYWSDTKVPKYQFVYMSKKSLAEGNWRDRTNFDTKGVRKGLTYRE